MMTNAPKPKDPGVAIIPGSSDASATLVITEEDHTLGNSLRYSVMRNADVVFCGYSMPHPSEEKVNLRIQTRPGATAEGAFKQGLADLSSMADHIKATFAQALEAETREAGAVRGGGAAAAAGGGKKKNSSSKDGGKKMEVESDDDDAGEGAGGKKKSSKRK